MCDISLKDFETLSSIAQNLSVALASLGTFAFAAYGVKSWLREFKGKRDTELCEEVLEKFYQAQEAIRWMRSPFVLTSELKGDAPLSERDSANQNARVLFDRYNAKQELFSSIHALRYRFMARFGKDEAIPFDNFHEAIGELLQSARSLARLWSRRYDPSQSAEWQKHCDRVEEKEKIFWGTGNDQDEFDNKIQLIIKDLEARCRSKIAS